MLSSLNVDGQAVSAESNYTFTNVVSNHTISATFVVDNSAPGVPSVSVSSKTTSSFTVSAVATDVDGDNLVYKLYVKQASESAYSLKATSASTASGTAVSFSVTGLGEYTEHNYYVTATDGKETSTSSTGSVKTYCSGTGCSTYQVCPYYSTCSDCNGVGHTCDLYMYTADHISSSDEYCNRCDKVVFVSSGAVACRECDSWGHHWQCNECGIRWYDVEYDGCDCRTCNQTGSYCYTHSTYNRHYTCPSHGYLGGSTTHCLHGYSNQH